jgi:ATP-dependent helicase HepA
MDAIGASLADSMAVPDGVRSGIFVRAPDDRYIGKLLHVEDNRAEVSFFHSLALRERAFFKLSELKRWFLYPQTRVYVRGEADQWRAGRVRPAYKGRTYMLNDDRSVDYEVQLPGGIKIDVSERDLEVRCLRPRSDPAEVLALRGGDTQFFHDRRWPTVEALTHLQAADRGLAGLTSAAIEFVPHQVSAVQRVLQDPLPRYLLADEVGLGKTIEAGAILRQWLIDDPALDAVVLAPAHIIGQWRSELTNRFRLDLTNQVKIIAHEETSLIASNSPAILVVDEAHRFTATDQNILSGPIGILARSAQRLLLLSATPSLVVQFKHLSPPEVLISRCKLLHTAVPSVRF